MFGAPAAPAAGGGFGKAPGGFGAPPAAGGFGKAPAAGGFGAPAPPAAGGFGAPPAAGGFGKAPAAGGFGAPAPAAGGFGAPPATTGFGAAAAPAAGFGKAPGGFGAPAPAAGAAPQQTGLGVGGFGTAPPAMQPAAGGFGAPATSGAFGQQQQAVSNVPLDPTRQSTIVRYLMEIDNAYNALHANCKFRTFVYNMCTPGLNEQAIARERYAAANAGGGCKEEDWVMAQRANPDPERMYPCPVHFFQGLQERVGKQTDIIDKYHKHVENIAQMVEELHTIHEDNNDSFKKLQREEAMLQRRWLAVLGKTEAIRQLGLPLGDERQLLMDRLQQLMGEMKSAGRFHAAAQELDQLLDVEAATSSARAARNLLPNEQSCKSSTTTTTTTGTSQAPGGGGGGGLLGSSATTSLVDPHTLKDWTTFLQRMQEGLESLRSVAQRDLKDVRSARRYLETR